LDSIKPQYQEGEVQRFSELFAQSGMVSIDAFLARRGDEKVGVGVSASTFSDIGKHAIAHLLINEEKKSTFHPGQDDHWLEYLWRHMQDAPKERFLENKVKIISFNYDRVVEAYFQTVLQNAYGLGFDEANQLVEQMPIVHVYGQLQPLTPASNGRAYGVCDDANASKHASNSIRVIPEQRDDDKAFVKAKSYLSDADRVCFLGFGFDSTNVRRLGLPSSLGSNPGSPVCYATTYQMKTAETQAIRALFGFAFRYADRIEARYQNLKCLEYLRETGVFI
jgi:hypothetical protein